MKIFAKGAGLFFLVLFTLSGASDSFSQVVNISPAEMYFGRIPEGSEAVRNLHIYSIHPTPLQVNAIRFEGADAALFDVVANPAPFTVAFAELQVVEIRYRPTTEGPASARVVITSNAGSSPDAIDLTGEGTDIDRGRIVFERIFGGPHEDGVGSVRIMPDGGYFLVGSTRLDDRKYGNAKFIKTDAYGKIEWEKIYDVDESQPEDWSSGFSEGILTADGGFIAVGSKSDAEHTKPADIWVVKTDAAGNVQWQKTLGQSALRRDAAADVIQTVDGGYLISGVSTSLDETTSPPKEHGDAYVIKLDASGNVEWEKLYGGRGGDSAGRIKPTSDGGYVFIGSTSTYSTGGESDYDFYLVKINANGDEIWHKTYGGSDWDRSGSVIVTDDGGYLMAGFTASPEYGAVARDVFLVKADAAGNEQWHKTYGFDHSDGASEVIATSDGGYFILGGSAQYYDPVLEDWRADIYVIKTDASGNMQWQQLYGGTHEEGASCVRQTSDGGYIISGTTVSYSSKIPNADIYLLKIDSGGGFTSVGKQAGATPKAFKLSQNYPNPFNSSTTIEYQLPKISHVQLNIYNLQGQLLGTLVNDYQQQGYYRITYDGDNLPTGLYFYQLQTANFQQTQRMLLLK